MTAEMKAGSRAEMKAVWMAARRVEMSVESRAVKRAEKMVVWLA